MTDASHQGLILDQFTRQATLFSTAAPITNADAVRMIVEAARRDRNSSFCDRRGSYAARRRRISEFNGLHSRRHDDEVQFYAFDMRNLMLVAFAAYLAAWYLLTPFGNTGLWIALLIFLLSRGGLQALRYPEMLRASFRQQPLPG